MDNGEEESNDSIKSPIRQIFSEFMAGVANLENLVPTGGNFLTRFQSSLDEIRRPQTHEKSKLVKSIIDKNDNNRIRSYTERGWAKTHDMVSHMCAINSCFEGLQDCLTKAKEIVCELQCLMRNAGIAVRVSPKVLSDSDFVNEDEIDDAEYCSFMAIVYCMVEKDYVMREKIVSALNLSTSAEDLDGYCLMWSLRPFVDDDVVNRALGYC